MTNDKINIQEIVDLISARLSISKKLIEEFFRVLLPIIEETLKAGEPVKIKNFGTLKMQWNNPRKSVNVNTGEEIIIEGYNKIVFVPEESLKELVNEPFAHLFPIELDGTPTEQIPENGPLRIINEQALEIKNILSEINQLNNRNNEQSSILTIDIEDKEIEIVDETNNDKIKNIDSVEKIENKFEPTEQENVEVTDKVELLPIADITEDTNENHDLLNQNEIEQEESRPNESQHEKDENQAEESSNVKPDNIITLITSKQEPTDNPKHKINIWWIAVPSIMVAAIVFLYFFNLDIYKFVNSKIESFMPEQKVAHNVIILPEDSTKTNQITIVKSPDDLFYENLLNKNRLYEELYTIERLTGDRTIYSLAEKYYGHSAFWIYIYDANKKEISDIWNIKRGTPLKIPVLDSMLIDTRNPRSFEIARNLLKTLTENPVTQELDSSIKVVKDSPRTLIKNDSTKLNLIQDSKKSPNQQFVEESKKTTTQPITVKKETEKTQVIEVKKETPKQKPAEVKKDITKPQPITAKKEIGKPQTSDVKKESVPGNTTILSTETMQEGSRLTIFARKYYGSKHFWVYIYEANKDVIKNPDNVPVGTKIKIPKLDSKLIDLNNPENIAKAKELEKKYLIK